MLDDLQVLTRPHPFKQETCVEVVESGKTIAQILDVIAKRRNINGWYTQNVYVEINGYPISAKQYDSVVVKKDDNLVVQFCVPEGGGGSGKNIIRAVLMIVVAAVAVYTGGLGVFAAGGALAGYGGVASAVVMIGGTLLVNALVPPTALSAKGLGHSDSTESDVYSISGMRNYAPNYKALPMVLGTVRYDPPYGALPYTKLVGNDQYVICDFVWGAGPLLIEDIKIGESLVSTYSDVRIATNSGYATDQELQIYPSDIYEENLSVVLTEGTITTRSTLADTQGFSVDLVFAQGLFALDDQGNRIAASVSTNLYFRHVGDAEWFGPILRTHTAATAKPLRINYSYDFPTFPDQYEVRIDRATPNKDETNTKLYDELTWIVIRSIKYKDPVTFDIPIAETQLEIKATDQLNGVIDTLNAKVTSVCLDYDINTGRWIERATNNPASLYRWVYQGPGCAKPLADEFIDLVALQEWHEFCAINKLTYNKVHDGQSSTQGIINDICHAGRATYVRIDDLRSVVIDKERQYGPVNYFTPENSSNHSLKKVFISELHGYRVLFNDESSDYQENEVTVYNKDYNYLNATLIESLEFPGITNIEQVKALTRYHMATRLYRSEVFSFTAIDWEHISCGRGDMIRVSNPVILVSIGTGRIKSVDLGIKQIVLDQEITFLAGVSYGLSVRTTATNTSYPEVLTIPVTPSALTTDTLTVSGSLPVTVVRGIIYGIGKLGYEALDLIVTSKRPNKDFGATITALQYSWNEIGAYLNGSFPEIHTGITSLQYSPRDTPPPPTISYWNVGPSAAEKLPDGTTLNRVIIMVTIPSGWKVLVQSVQAEILVDGAWVRSSNTNPAAAFVFDDIYPGDVEIRVRSVSASGLTSAWVYRTITQIQGTPVPDPIRAMTAEGQLFQNKIEWSNPVDFRANYFDEIYCSAGSNNRDSATRIAKLSDGPAWTHTGLIPGVQYYYWMLVSDDEGNRSAWYPLSATGGIQASPTQDPSLLLDMLTGSISDSALTTELLTRIDSASEKTISQQTLLSDQWTVKIQEINDTPYLVGVGLILYPDYNDDDTFHAGEYVWMESRDEVYKLPIGAADQTGNPPPLPPWELVPYGRKSQFSIMADQFAVVLPDGTGKSVPFVVNGDAVGIDGELIVDGTVYARALSATDTYTMTLQSQNYEHMVSGYKINAVTGIAEFNNFDMSFYDPAAAINANVTKVNGTKISTTSLSAIIANLGTITAGQLNFGSFTGYAWPVGYGVGAHLSANGLLAGNPSTGQYIQITQAGQLYGPGFSIAGGNATFSGTLAANIVTTNAINGGAVNEISIAARYDTITISGSAFNIIEQVPVTSLGTSKVLIDITLDASIATGAWNRVYLYRDGTPIRVFELGGFYSVGVGIQSKVFKHVDTPGAGTFYYRVYCLTETSSGGGTIGNITLLAQNVKK